MKRFWLLILVAQLFVSSAAVNAEEKKLSLRECIDTALKSQPAIRAAQGNVSAGLGRETQAASPYFPQVSAHIHRGTTN